MSFTEKITHKSFAKEKKKMHLYGEWSKKNCENHYRYFSFSSVSFPNTCNQTSPKINTPYKCSSVPILPWRSLHRRRNHCRQSFLFLFQFRFPVTADQISRRHVATFDLYSSVSSSTFNPQRSGNKFKNPIMFSFYTPASFGSITNVGRWIRFNFCSISYQIALTSRRSNTKTSPML